MCCKNRNFFSPYTLYEHSQNNFFFSEKKFRFLQSAVMCLFINKLQPKYFRNIFFLNFSFFLFNLLLDLHTVPSHIIELKEVIKAP